MGMSRMAISRTDGLGAVGSQSVRSSEVESGAAKLRAPGFCPVRLEMVRSGAVGSQKARSRVVYGRVALAALLCVAVLTGCGQGKDSLSFVPKGTAEAAVHSAEGVGGNGDVSGTASLSFDSSGSESGSSGSVTAGTSGNGKGKESGERERILGATEAHVNLEQQQVILDYLELFYQSLSRLEMPERGKLEALFTTGAGEEADGEGAGAAEAAETGAGETSSGGKETRTGGEVGVAETVNAGKGNGNGTGNDAGDDNGAGQAGFHWQAWDYLIGLRKQQESDLHLAGYRYELEVYETEPREDGSLLVVIAERSIQNFAQHPQEDSENPRLRHDFLLRKENGHWKIGEHMQWDGVFWNMVKERKDEDFGAIPEEYYMQRKELLLEQDRQEQEKRREEVFQSGAQNSQNAQTSQGQGGTFHPYDREKAVAYGLSWVGYRNPKWPDFSGSGGNCQNFVSQCLLAGGIPMDPVGPDVWKWYGDELNNEATETGGSVSWINVDSFFQYARDNTGFGLAADTGCTYREGQVGDVIRMGTPQDWNHVVLITGVVKNEKGETIDYRICSNTSEMKNFPASAYPLPCKSLIRILGWREEEVPASDPTE